MNVIHKKEGVEKPNLVSNQEEKRLYEIIETLPKPTASMKLSAAQKKWWVWFGLEFVKTKQISQLDLTHLQKAAVWMDIRCKAISEINSKGYVGGVVQYFSSGASNVSAHISALEKADKHLDEVSSHFGLSIKDRQKLEVEPGDSSQLSLFESLYKKASQLS